MYFERALARRQEQHRVLNEVHTVHYQTDIVT